MTTLDALVMTEAQAAQITIINQGFTDRQLSPALDKAGRKVLPADLLTDCGPGQTWAAYAAVLSVLDRETVEIPDASTDD